MGKNSNGGKNNKKKKNSTYDEKSRELLYKDVDQEYALVTGLLGDSRCKCKIYESSEEVRGDIRGKLKNKVWINVGDTILMSKRPFDPTVYDIIHKYNPTEVSKLKSCGEITIPEESTDDNGSLANFGFEFSSVNIETI